MIEQTAQLRSALRRLVAVANGKEDDHAIEYAEKLLDSPQSPALRVMLAVYDGRSKSWVKLNKALRYAMKALILGNVEFYPDDIEQIFERTKGGYWIGKTNNRNMGEWIYSLAIEAGNNTAWKSFEQWTGRRPFIIDKKRLYIGYEFNWMGNFVTVTSFNDDNGTAVACSYEKVRHESSVMIYDTEKIRHRYIISHADIKEHNQRVRESEKTAAII